VSCQALSPRQKAASEEFYSWLKTYWNESDFILNCQSSTTVYADSGVCTTSTNNRERALAFSICRGDNKDSDYILLEDSFKCGLITLFNAEIAAAAVGIEKAVELLQGEFDNESRTAPEWHDHTSYKCTLILCIDNQAAALSILLDLLRIGYAPAVCAATRIRHFLDLYHKHKFVAIWVPSHTTDMTFKGAAMPHSLSIRGNNRIDKLCTSCFTGKNSTPNTRTKAATVAILKEKHLRSWRKDLGNVKQRGQKCLLRKKDISRLRHSGTKHNLLCSSGNNMVLYARLCRTVSNHAPTGEFMVCFKKDGHHQCLCNPTELTSKIRDHVLYHCPFWIREEIELT
jgi:hypothetical protein